MKKEQFALGLNIKYLNKSIAVEGNLVRARKCR